MAKPRPFKEKKRRKPIKLRGSVKKSDDREQWVVGDGMAGRQGA